MREDLQRSIATVLSELGVDAAPSDVVMERPLRIEHGDWSTNAALVYAKLLGKKPRDLASEICDKMAGSGLRHLERVEVAGPGFVNFHLSIGWLHDILLDVISKGEEGYARFDFGSSERVNLEFVSANPTGPIHVGNGWWGAYGDSLGRVMARCGYAVHREYYVNDTGRQVRMLGESVLARKFDSEVPDDGYQGEYVSQLAKSYSGHADAMVAGKWASEMILEEIKETLASIGIEYDAWFSQASIEESGALDETIDELRVKGLVEERDGATWFMSHTAGLGDSRDRVLVRSDGTPTYLGGDLAYHRNKFLVRGFDRVVDIFGADHQGQVASLKCGMDALGVDTSRLEILIGQMISLVEGGKSGKMSKRLGNFVSLDELIKDLGSDAVRLLALMGSLDQASTLDLDVVRSQSMENPVYYIQYAYARICSLERVREERSIERVPIENVDIDMLSHPRELELLRVLETMPDTVREACEERAPHKVTAWVRKLAAAFHGFYHDCPILFQDPDQDDSALMQARLWLVEACRTTSTIAFSLLGVSAPERM